MTNYNERLDEVFETLNNKAREERASCTERNNWDGYNFAYERLENEAKQAITSLTKELVAEAKPPMIDTTSRIKLYADDEGQMWYDRGQNDTIARFEQNLLKALEEK